MLLGCIFHPMIVEMAKFGNSRFCCAPMCGSEDAKRTAFLTRVTPGAQPVLSHIVPHACELTTPNPSSDRRSSHRRRCCSIDPKLRHTTLLCKREKPRVIPRMFEPRHRKKLGEVPTETTLTPKAHHTPRHFRHHSKIHNNFLLSSSREHP